MQRRAAHDSRPQSIVLYCIVDPGLDMSAGMIHRIGVRGCWRCRWPFGSQLFINSGLRAGLCLPFSVLPRTSSYTAPNPLLLLPLFCLLYSSHILLYLLHTLLVSTVTIHLQDRYTTTLRLLPTYHFQDGSIVSKCRIVGSIGNSRPVDQSSVSLVWESIVT